MKKHIRTAIIALPIICLMLLVFWPDSPVVILKKNIKRAGVDKNIDTQEYINISKFILINKQKLNQIYPMLYDKDSLNHKGLCDFVRELYDNKNVPEIVSPKTSANTAIEFYIDNSGSMDGYVNGNTDFKNALSYSLGKITYYYDTNAISLNMINSKIYPIDKLKKSENDIVYFIANLSPASQEWQMGGGGKNATKLNEIIKQVLNRTTEAKICGFISDGIYSLDKGTDTYGRLNIQKNLTMTSLLQKLKTGNEFSMLILKLDSKFNGTYYNYLNQPVKTSQNRPYYLFFIGPGELLIELSNRVEFSELPGYKDKVFFSNIALNNCYYSILENSNKSGIFQADNNHSAKNYIHGIKNIKINKGAPLQFQVCINCRSAGLDDSFLMDKGNYTVSEDFIITNIEPYSKAKLDLNDKKMIAADNPTHVLTLQCAKYLNQKEVVVTINNKIPGWVDETSIDDDLDISKSINKTFGLKYFVEGIYQAYKTKYNISQLYSFPISIK